MEEIDYDAAFADQLEFEREYSRRSRELCKARGVLEEERLVLQKQINKINSEINKLEEEYEDWFRGEVDKRVGSVAMTRFDRFNL